MDFHFIHKSCIWLILMTFMYQVLWEIQKIKGWVTQNSCFRGLHSVWKFFSPRALESHALFCSVVTAQYLKLEVCLLISITGFTKHCSACSTSHYLFCVTFSDLNLFPCSWDLHSLAHKQFSNVKIYVLSDSTKSIKYGISFVAGGLSDACLPM